MQKAKRIVSDTSVMGAGSANDTIRLWESYRDQAIMWRALALLQTPVTFVVVVLAFTIYQNRVVTLDVPQRPKPGIYPVQEIPDSAFIENAETFVNLIATYQPMNAQRQFQEARRMLIEPMLTKFEEEMMLKEIQQINQTNRTQIFFIDPTKTDFVRGARAATVQIEGERLKMSAQEQMPLKKTRYIVQMEVIPRNPLNEYGIVITNVVTKNLNWAGNEI